MTYTDSEYILEEGHRVNEKKSLIERMWPSNLPEVNVDVVGYPDEDLIGYQISYKVDGNLYGREIPEDINDQMDPEEFQVIVETIIDKFEQKYNKLTL